MNFQAWSAIDPDSATEEVANVFRISDENHKQEPEPHKFSTARLNSWVADNTAIRLHESTSDEVLSVEQHKSRAQVTIRRFSEALECRK